MSIAASLLLGVLIVVVITAFTGYFVAQEFAYMAVDRSRLQAAADQGDVQARRTLAITKRTSFMLSGAQLGITVTGLLVGYVAEPLIGESLARLWGWDGPDAATTGVALVLGSVVALSFSTLIQMLLGELFPKNYAIARSDAVARLLSTSTRIYLTVCGPLIWVFDRSAEGLLRLLRIEPVHDVEHSATAHDLEAVVQDSAESGDLPAELSLVLERILDFPRHDVQHAMVPRNRVDVIRQGTTVRQARAEMASGHTRYPVIDPVDDTVLGVVHLQDVLPCETPEAVVEDLIRPAVVVHEFMDLPDALSALVQAHDELAVVVDEYGGFSGILTIEDLAEEIVGDLVDEHDEPNQSNLLRPDADGWLTAGDTPVDEVERALGIELPHGPYQTISGLVVDLNRTLPAVGDVVSVPLPVSPEDLITADEPPVRLLLADVLEVERHVPVLIRLTLATSEVPGEGGDR